MRPIARAASAIDQESIAVGCPDMDQHPVNEGNDYRRTKHRLGDDHRSRREQ